MPISPEQANARARLANASRRGDSAAAAKARADLAEATLARELRAALDRYRRSSGYTPPKRLTVEQKGHLAALVIDTLREAA